MKLSGKTWMLAVVAALLAILNLVGEAAPDRATLPSLASFAVDDVTRVVISTPVDRIELTRTSAPGTKAEDTTWEIVTPLQYAADAAQVRSLLRSFSPGVPMEALVDEGNLDDYAVDDQHGKLLEVFTNGPEPVVSVTVGKTAAGGTTFVRITGGETVYRADVGGRARFDQPAADWRDKMALNVDFTQIDHFTVTRGAEVLRFERGPSEDTDKEGKPIPGHWVLPSAPFAIDSDTVDALVRGLSRLRAGEIHAAEFDGGFDPPLAVAELGFTDGSSHRLVVGTSAVGDASYVKVDDRPSVFQVAGQVRRQLALPLEGLRDRTLLRVSRKELESVSLVDGGLTVVLTQSDDGSSWAITQPPNMEADQRQALFTVNTLAALRAFDVAPDPTFTPSGARFVLRFRDGHSETVELGQAERDADNQPLVRVRVGGRPGVYRVKATQLAELRKAFGRG